MRKSNNPQTRSYILLTYDNVKNAIRAKQELSRRKDLLGDKRVEVAVLLSEESILRGRNIQNTIERFQTPNNYEKRGKGNAPSYNPNSFQSIQPMYNQYAPPPPPSYSSYPPSHPSMMMPPIPSSNPNIPNIPPNMGSMNPSYYPPPPPMYYPNMYGDPNIPFNYTET